MFYYKCKYSSRYLKLRKGRIILSEMMICEQNDKIDLMIFS